MEVWIFLFARVNDYNGNRHTGVFSERTLKVKKIYVGNLPWRATEQEIREFFEPFGEVLSVAIITDRETGRSRGFGFVEMDDDGADAAIAEANGKEFGGRPLRINEALEKRRGGGGGGGGARY